MTNGNNVRPNPPQDELIKAKAAVHEAEKALRLREIDVLERDRRVRGGVDDCGGGR